MSTIGAFAKNFGLAMTGKNPWGGKSDGSGGGQGSDSDGSGSGKPKGPRNPWLPGGIGGSSNGSGDSGGEEPRRSANIEDIFKKRGPGGPRQGGGGGPRGPNFRLPERPGGKSWLPLGIGLIVIVWLAMSMSHKVQPKEQGVVTFLGSYSRTLPPGFHFTLPAPFELVHIENVSGVRLVRIPEGEKTEKLILTGDQNLVDLTYLIRWNISDLALYRFRLARPEETVKEAAEAAMRSAVAEKTLDETFSGSGRSEIEERVRTRLQAILDRYHAGITIQGVEIDKTDPPEIVNDAFKDVSAAEQNADAARNTARGFAQQILSKAEGETAAFDKVYEQYRLAPRVTRQRLYYETMERVLGQNDKTIIETQGVTSYLPLPEIRKRAHAAPSEPTITVEGR